VTARLPAILMVAATFWPAWAAEPDGAALDLMDGYWRYHFTFCAARVSPAELAKLGTDATKPRLGRPFYYDLGWYAGHGTSTDLAYLIRSAPPPSDWARAEFDDSAWLRHKKPFLTGGASHLGLAVELACFRTCLMVDDPERAQGLRLELTYRGGVAVYVNGQELARGHLPEGELKPDTPGEDYPLEAYTLPPMDLVPGNNQRRAVPELWPDAFPGPKGGDETWVKDQFKANPQAFKIPTADVVNYYRQGCGRWTFTRQEYEKVRDLRDRKLGPVEIPKALLRKGTNVIAIELHRSDLNPVIHDYKRLGSHYGWGYFGGVTWMHGLLKYARIVAPAPGAVRAEERPAGLQVWTDDIHRRYFSPEFGPAGQAPAPLRLVGARNGSYSGQVVLGTNRARGDVNASVGDLVQAGGGKVPAGAVSVRYGVPLPVVQLAAMGADRSAPRWRDPLRSESVHWAVGTHGPKEAATDKKIWSEAAASISFFDQLGTAAPKAVPANSCLPLWVTVKIPRDARPGEYRGELSIAAGGASAKVPVRLWVMDWALPDPAEFETVMALEHSPYGVAAHYRVEPWSDEHFRLMESSFRLLAEVGNDYLVVPVLLGSEFGNRDDSPVIFVKRADGSYGCDLSRFEKYLDLAVRSGWKPRCVCFVLTHAMESEISGIKRRVRVRDEAAGTEGPADLPVLASPETRGMLEPFVRSALEALRKRGLEKAAHWGYLWDSVFHPKDPEYFSGMHKLLADLAPTVGWARGCHNPGGHGPRLGEAGFTFISTIYNLASCHRRDKATGQLEIISLKGWRNPMLHMVLPRVVNTVITVEGASPPLCYRLAPERAIVHGARGLARIGADYWADAYHGGWRGGVQVGMPITMVLWPGPNGAESSARFECLKEGVQETEARILLERNLESLPADGPLARTAQEVLTRRIQETLHIPPTYSEPRISEYYGGWQERSWDLYAAAAIATGGKAPPSEERSRFFGNK